ncbi:2-oxoglutarate dehydrogenase complex dihydrolipoyllysine-residue succinyltransferase [Candidatus Vallotia tarda]|uniref:Dihydrolipoyllysine-residue succinyltransferase component of 2-oxoglutarate dehydrogenase complex n=1 Tax=Candidatus Vallotiella hemipterorum TaxID=1177213 RepID=A0A916JTP3_9BURK|nr:2-oxoglutarate dehydrogenase complex dihydrolipoyllysine-residue succinyltransferase [Candidatus Vallotia tarda]CAG7602374.1 Dihydrolipoyllysine-residue succinyltransferase component of 2-oxoglutarate dehydrogenase complex [Candidatus Vallotia tarda]
MAIIEIKVPRLSESVSEATMLGWKKQPGEAVVQDEILIEIETDKVVLEVPAPASGILSQIIKHAGDTVIADDVIAQIDTELKANTAVSPIATKNISAEDSKAKFIGQTLPIHASSSLSSVASPAASQLLREKNLRADQLTGTGRGGRVTKGDVLSTSEIPLDAALPQVDESYANSWITDRPEQRVPMSRLRVRIAERLLESQQTNAILTTFNEVNMAPVINLRSRYQDCFIKEHEVKLGFMSFFVKAVVHALQKFPILNASIDKNNIVYHGYFDIGVAVGSPRGLVVPILRNVDQMGFADIEKKISEFSSKARDGKLSIEEISGGTFSISNGGIFGSMLSTPIINPPQSAILGVHATKERPVVENGQIVIRPINYLALSYDHRLIDGREAVLSLIAIKEVLENPERLLLNI